MLFVRCDDIDDGRDRLPGRKETRTKWRKIAPDVDRRITDIITKEEEEVVVVVVVEGPGTVAGRHIKGDLTILATSEPPRMPHRDGPGVSRRHTSNGPHTPLLWPPGFRAAGGPRWDALQVPS
ncbi:hypothetical protein O3P69_011434 [Scylla paramamosain]|uniref:Uncharacterized protein n=1 Tax=Scylla paramamosain TaxID=85552 RepID=A0AAW0T5P9_SCYPA